MYHVAFSCYPLFKFCSFVAKVFLSVIPLWLQSWKSCLLVPLWPRGKKRKKKSSKWEKVGMGCGGRRELSQLAKSCWPWIGERPLLSNVSVYSLPLPSLPSPHWSGLPLPLYLRDCALTVSQDCSWLPLPFWCLPTWCKIKTFQLEYTGTKSPAGEVKTISIERYSPMSK